MTQSCSFTEECHEDGGFHGICPAHRAQLYPGGAIPTVPPTCNEGLQVAPAPRVETEGGQVMVVPAFIGTVVCLIVGGLFFDNHFFVTATTCWMASFAFLAAVSDLKGKRRG